MKKLIVVLILSMCSGLVTGQETGKKEAKNFVGFSIFEFVNNGIGGSYERTLGNRLSIGDNFRYYYTKNQYIREKGGINELYVKMDVLQKQTGKVNLSLYSTIFGQYRDFHITKRVREAIEGTHDYRYVYESKYIIGFGAGFTWGVKMVVSNRFFMNVYAGSQIRFTKNEEQINKYSHYSYPDYNGVSPRIGLSLGVAF